MWLEAAVCSVPITKEKSSVDPDRKARSALTLIPNPSIGVENLLLTGRGLTEPYAELEQCHLNDAAKIPVLAVHGAHDENAPLSAISSFVRSLEADRARLVVLDDYGHDFPTKAYEAELQAFLAQAKAADK